MTISLIKAGASINNRLKEIEPNDYNGIAAYGACEANESYEEYGACETNEATEAFEAHEAYGACEANEEYMQIEEGFIEVADESV